MVSSLTSFREEVQCILSLHEHDVRKSVHPDPDSDSGSWQLAPANSALNQEPLHQTVDPQYYCISFMRQGCAYLEQKLCA